LRALQTMPIRPSRTVLVVDDDEGIRDVLEIVLEEAGYRVVSASNGRAGLAYLRTSRAPDAVLLDLFMPLMNGWEFVREAAASERTAKIPIIVMTAAGSHWGYPLPGERIMHKPIQSEHLLRMLRQVCGDCSDRGDRDRAALIEDRR
jgi:CheY-like chemotaxis protein